MSDSLRLQVTIQKPDGETTYGHPRWETGASVDLMVDAADAWEVYRWVVARVTSPRPMNEGLGI